MLVYTCDFLPQLCARVTFLPCLLCAPPVSSSLFSPSKELILNASIQCGSCSKFLYPPVISCLLSPNVPLRTHFLNTRSVFYPECEGPCHKPIQNDCGFVYVSLCVSRDQMTAPRFSSQKLASRQQPRLMFERTVAPI